jgi:hypothetical protein
VGPPGERPRDISRGLLRGLRFNVDPANKSMRLLGLDEREIAGAVEEASASPVAAAMDIGANDGWYSLYFASRPNIEKVWAFEPEQWIIDRLHANFALNAPAFAEKLNVTRKLVGDRDDDRFCSVDVILGDYAKPLVLKIDVDGGEMEVLNGARRTLENKQCTLVVETHSEQLERDCIAFLERMGYRTRIIKTGWYRAFVPEGRGIAFNRWFVARR